ncbi:MAG TPA: hypothetical protein VHI97_01310 [Actinomycetota bacterium]|nr:hypothetical protein [Actinomycetota bacterium]
MQWLLTAVVLGAACWMVSALTYGDEGAAAAPSRLLNAGRESLPRVAAASRTTVLRWSQAVRSALLRFGHAAGPVLVAAGRAVATVIVKVTTRVGSAIWWVLRTVGMAFAAAARTVGATAGRTRTAMQTRAATRQRTRMERRRLAQTAQRYSVPFEKSLILTGLQEEAAGMSLPAFSASARRPSALSRLLAAIQLVFLVVIWGSAAALAIAGAAWAVTRIV